MKFGIKSKLLGGFAVILLLFAGMFTYTLFNMRLLKQQVQMTNDHPLTVTRAVINIEVNVTAIHRTMKDVALSKNSEERKKYILKVLQYESKSQNQFDIVLRQILGEEGKKLALAAKNMFLGWQPIRKRVIDLMEEGKYEQAQKITQTEGDSYVGLIVDELKKLEEYAAVKGIGFTRESSRIAARTQKMIIISFIIFASLSISIVLAISLSITNRLKNINLAATKISKGKLDIKINIKGSDEINQLAESFNDMTTKLNETYASLEQNVLDRTKEIRIKNDELQQLQHELEDTVKERTKDLELKVKELDRSEKAMLYMVEDLNKIYFDLENTNKQLESKKETLEKSTKSLALLMEDVNESRKELYRSNKKLDSTNKELEAFSYSVSHDLRAPLRHIDGFTKLLYKEIKNLVNEKSQSYFSNIISSSRQMSQLIDELLVFSRMSRKEITKNQINMKIVVQEALKIFDLDIKENKVSVKIDEMPKVTLDAAMMRQVWENLISNAIKFSSKQENPNIHIGTEKDANGNTVFFIKDNGVGFNQKYVDKIFGVFQRIHNVNEFPGTGIGLANVKRIINKHGGDIWAEGDTGVGAAFFFTLPNA